MTDHLNKADTVRKDGIIKILLTLLVICIVSALVPSSGVRAADNYVRFEGNGDINGIVGQELEPYYFTLHIEGGTINKSYAKGADATDFFQGKWNPLGENPSIPECYNHIPMGLKIYAAEAVSADASDGQFVIKGTPIIGSTQKLYPDWKNKNFFPSGSYDENAVYISTWLVFNITRADTYSATFSPSSLKITGTKGSAISNKELSFSVTGANFIKAFAAGTDVTSWFNCPDVWITPSDAYGDIQETITSVIPDGLKATLKNAIKVGGSDFTVVFSGTPAYGAYEFIACKPEAGAFSVSGSAKSEWGYSETLVDSWEKQTDANGKVSYISHMYRDYDFMFDIAGETNKPYVTVDDIAVTGKVDEALTEQVITFRLHNCTLNRTVAAGTDVTGNMYRMYSNRIVQYLKPLGLHAEIVSLNAGESSYQIKLTGTPKAYGNGPIVMAFSWMEDPLPNMMTRINANATWRIRTPDTKPHLYISEDTLSFTKGFEIDSYNATAEAGIYGGDDAANHDVMYCLGGTFEKNKDVTEYFSGLPGGVRAYVADTVSNPYDQAREVTSNSEPGGLSVYFAGIPTASGTFNVKFKTGAYKYSRIAYDKVIDGKTYPVVWDPCATALVSDAQLTITVAESSESAYAYDLSLEDEIAGLFYTEFTKKADSVPLEVGGRILSVEKVYVQDGTPTVKTESDYNIAEKTFKLYLPKITISKDYADDADITDFVRLKSGTPLENYKIRTDGEISKGTHYGLTLQVYISNEKTTAVSSVADFEVEIYDGSTWRDVKMPAGSAYDIFQIYNGETAPDTSKVKGLSASIADCSINGITYTMLQDSEGVELSISGAQFTINASGRYHDVTNWFTNLPSNVYAMVKASVKDEVRSTIKIVFARRKTTVTYSTPYSSSTDPIGITIPFKDITTLDGSDAPWSGFSGGVVISANSNARWNILDEDTFARSDMPMVVSNTLTGVYKEDSDGGIGTGWFSLVAYLPKSIVDQMEAEAQEHRAYMLEQDPEWQEEFSATLNLRLYGEEGLFTFNQSHEYIDMLGSGYKKLSGTSADIYTISVGAGLDQIEASKLASGLFEVKWLSNGRECTLDSTNTYVKYRILDKLPEEDEDDGDDDNGDDNDDNGDDNSSKTSTGIDYTAREDVIIYATDASGATVNGTYINLTKETFVTDLSYTYYSVNGGSKWKKGPLSEKKAVSLLNKGVTLAIVDKFDTAAKEPADDAVIYKFGQLAQRPAAPKYKVNYLKYADNTGKTTGGWTLMDASGAVLDDAALAALEIGIAGSDKKTLTAEGYGLWPEGKGIALEALPSTGKPATTIYYIRVKPSDTTPASKAVKISVKGQQKSPNVKIDYKKETIKLKAGMIVSFGENAPESATELSANASTFADFDGKVYIADTKEKASGGLNISGYLGTGRNKIRVWTMASAKKAASAPSVIELAARGQIAAETLSVTGGKLKLDKKYEVYDESKSKWGGMPKVSASCELKIRLKATAKGGKESDSTYAASDTAKLVITYGTVDAEKNKQGITEAKIVLIQEETKEQSGEEAIAE